VSVAGEWSNLYKLIDKIRKKSGIEIISYEYNAVGGAAGAPAGAGPVEPDRVHMVLKLYVFVKGVPASTGSADAAVQ
jgi:hypothetical protein